MLGRLYINVAQRERGNQSRVRVISCLARRSTMYNVDISILDLRWGGRGRIRRPTENRTEWDVGDFSGRQYPRFIKIPGAYLCDTRRWSFSSSPKMGFGRDQAEQIPDCLTEKGSETIRQEHDVMVEVRFDARGI